ncbi:acetoacetate decarboxylase family protein [Halorussus sp. AFM4]|uniref:acetoacetate decarboxylase family protein n=1 Tax=Halorussus sp. AFM4 TaxID=3421651 RepID=UPI003EB9412F
MSSDDRGRDEGRTERRLSTGQIVDLPLACEFTAAGGLFPASARRLAARLPERLSPVRVAPGTGAVALVSIEYHYVGGLEPYDEFAVAVPVVADARTELPGAQLLGADVGGYVDWLPVTTEASVALGTEIWGYPKELATIDVEDRGGVRRTTVSVGGGRVLTLGVGRASGRDRGLTARSYTVKDSRLLASRAALAGEFAVRPLSRRVSLSLGDHDRADALRELGVRGRSLGRLYAPRARARLGPGRPAGE